MLQQQAPAIARMAEEAEQRFEEERVRAEAAHREYLRREAERRHELAIKASREELLTIVEGWALATRLEDFFEDVEAGAASLGKGEREALVARLERARELFGGPEAMKHFRCWKTPEER